MYILH